MGFVLVRWVAGVEAVSSGMAAEEDRQVLVIHTAGKRDKTVIKMCKNIKIKIKIKSYISAAEMTAILSQS